jgi:hypothetical protein
MTMRFRLWCFFATRKQFSIEHGRKISERSISFNIIKPSSNMRHSLLIIAILIAGRISAQEFSQISAGPGYGNQSFYSLESDQEQTVPNESWDLAFSLVPESAGVHFNEATASVMGAPAPFLEVYVAPGLTFEEVVDLSGVTDTLYNPETNWGEGAFNTPANPADLMDVGWGKRNPTTGEIEGDRVFVVKLRDETYRKVMIEKQNADGVYAVRTAMLNGMQEVLFIVDPADYGSSPLAFLSFSTSQVTAAPTGWDLAFLRYRSLIFDGTQPLQYAVTGILTAPGVEVAQADQVDPETVGFEEYADSLETRIEVIGEDWKYFNLSAFSWEIVTDRAYFVKLPDNHIWKLQFIDFEGSSTGTATFIKYDLGIVTSTKRPESLIRDFGIFPNPVAGQLNLAFSLNDQPEQVEVQVFDLTGRLVWSVPIEGHQGLNGLSFQVPDTLTGLCQVVIATNAGQVSQLVMFQ